MNIAVTGSTGLIGRRLVATLLARGDEVTVLSRDPERARGVLGVTAERWDPPAEPAPAGALSGRDGVIHLAGEPLAQRWTTRAREAIRASREIGTRNLVHGLSAAAITPGVLVSASAVGFYGSRGDEQLDESAGPGSDFVAAVCVAWEREAQAAEELGMRVARVRAGVVLDPHGGALAKMLPPFRLGIGGPVAGGRQWLSWIHADDIVAIYLAALDGDAWRGPVNASAPEPARNHDFSRALGRALRRPALLPVPALALRALYGDMAQIVTAGQRVVPAFALEHGFAFRHPDLDEALRSAIG
ncbi:MAG: TIGR01777 family oxidoreductase [Solirubrobacteraceae bacterium]|nr:TIGR01777 family oxidoreductase [Solirubrobacteraceae bacterium]